MSMLRNITKGTLLFIGATAAVGAGACAQDYKTSGSKKSLVLGFGLGVVSGLCLGTAAGMEKNDIINKTIEQIVK